MNMPDMPENIEESECCNCEDCDCEFDCPDCVCHVDYNTSFDVDEACLLDDLVERMIQCVIAMTVNAQGSMRCSVADVEVDMSYEEDNKSEMQGL
jgi:hypothetical protein